MAYDSPHPDWIDCHDLRRDEEAGGHESDETGGSLSDGSRNFESESLVTGGLRLIDPGVGERVVVARAWPVAEPPEPAAPELSEAELVALMPSHFDAPARVSDPVAIQPATAALQIDPAAIAAKVAEEIALAEAAAKARREAEEKARLEAEAKAKAEAEAKARKEAEERARKEAEEQARRAAEEKARKAAEAKAKKEAEERARKEAEEKAKREAAEKARKEAEAKAKKEAEEKARREAEEKAKREAEEKARKEAEAKAKREAEEKARRETEEKARKEAEEKARREAEARAKKEAEEKAKREAEAKAKAEAEEKARQEAEAEAKAKKEAEERARKEAEEEARREAEEKARREAEAKAQAEAKAKKEAEEKAKAEKEAADASAKAEASEKAAARKKTPTKKPKKAEAEPEAASVEPSPPADLGKSFKRLIRETGPISLARYMAESNARYYASRDPLGDEGDFITAPEVSQMFGELIGLWFADLWVRMGARKHIHYVELGPGRGTLAKDALGTAARYDFDPQIHFVEGSPALRKIQKEAFPKATHHHDLSTLPDDAPLLVMANEFFDALPIHQLVRSATGWHERMVGLEGDELAFVAGDTPMDSIVPKSWVNATQGTMIETSAAAVSVMTELATRLKEQGGAALIIDYGARELRAGSTLQALRNHEKVDVLSAPGEADLTAHVDFELLQDVARRSGADVMGLQMQGDWLVQMGIDIRHEALERKNPGEKEKLQRQYDRLVQDNQMGALFKVLGICGRRWPIGVGFD